MEALFNTIFTIWKGNSPWKDNDTKLLTGIYIFTAVILRYSVFLSSHLPTRNAGSREINSVFVIKCQRKGERKGGSWACYDVKEQIFVPDEGKKKRREKLKNSSNDFHQEKEKERLKKVDDLLELIDHERRFSDWNTSHIAWWSYQKQRQKMKFDIGKHFINQPIKLSIS